MKFYKGCIHWLRKIEVIGDHTSEWVITIAPYPGQSWEICWKTPGGKRYTTLFMWWLWLQKICSPVTFAFKCTMAVFFFARRITSPILLLIWMKHRKCSTLALCERKRCCIHWDISGFYLQSLQILKPCSWLYGMATLWFYESMRRATSFCEYISLDYLI